MNPIICTNKKSLDRWYGIYISVSFYYLNSLSPDKWSSIVCVTREYAPLTRFKCRSSQTYNFVGIPNNTNCHHTHDEEQKALLHCAFLFFFFFLSDLTNPVGQSITFALWPVYRWPGNCLSEYCVTACLQCSGHHIYITMLCIVPHVL